MSSFTQLGPDFYGEAESDGSGIVSVSSDGSTLAIGAIANDGNGNNSGHTRIYKWNGTAWNQRGSDIDGEANNDENGRSVSLSSDGTIDAISSPPTIFSNRRGQTRLYQWSGSAWVQIGSDVDGEANNDQSGYLVSLSSDGSTVAIGANHNDGNGRSSGHVRVFK